MATIALYAGKVNQMPGLVGGIRKSVTDYKSELSALRAKSLQINQSICDLSSVINSIQAASQIQDQKADSLEVFQKNSEQFMEDVTRIDNNVADVINFRKDDFYEKFNYLKPACEKNWLEVGIDTVGGWCKKHWKELVIGIAFIVVGSIVTAFTGGLFIPALLAGLKAAAIAGVISGGISVIISMTCSIINGDSFETFLYNAFDAFVAGFASGFMFGGIMAGVSMTISGGFRLAANAGFKTGRRAGIGKDGIFKILSPDKLSQEGGGTLIKIGKTFRIDFDLHIPKGYNPLQITNFMHMHFPGISGDIPGLLIVRGHIPLGIYISGLLGGTFNKNKEGVR